MFHVFSLLGFFPLSLPFSSFFQGARACGSKESKEGYITCQGAEGKQVPNLFICLLYFSPHVSIFCIFKW